jgi:acyl-CoA synthetase (AMP-forming)/AMP-acid ligase II
LLIDLLKKIIPQELDRAATSLASYLLNSCKLKAGDRALLVFFPGLQFMASLIACFKAGIIAIPVFPPDPRRLQKDLHHFISIQNSSGAAVALTHGMYNFAKKVSDIQGIFKSKALKWPEIRWLVIDDVLARGKEKGATNDAGPPLPPAPKSGDIAFLQYTSGSTSEPKGVMISHGNLGHNLTLIVKELKANKATVNVSWLPQYHDMGLIGKLYDQLDES